MGIYGMMRTGVSGMNAQSNKLSTISDNIGNSGTAGYKRASTEFSSLLLGAGSGDYNSGAVNTQVRYGIGKQGARNSSSVSTDMMIDGAGFFNVSDPSGKVYLTRAGSFRIDGSSGNLVNAAGFTLMGYDISQGPAAITANSTQGMVPVNFQNIAFAANPTTKGVMNVNLPTPAKAGDAIADQTTSLTAYDNVGNKVKLDVTYKYTAGTPGSWAMSVKATNEATGGTSAVGPIALTFDAKGQITNNPATTDIALPNGQTLSLDFAKTTNLSGPYQVVKSEMNGNAASLVKNVSVDSNGIVYAVDPSGQRKDLFQIPITTVPNPDGLRPLAGNVFEMTTESGNFQIQPAGMGGAGQVLGNATEASTVDMATELTDMIVAQRDFTANSKVVQTGSELLDVIMSLKR